MAELLISHQAINAMQWLSGRVQTETGGILLGALLRPAVLLAGEPGPRAVKTPASFSTDPEHDAQLLKEARREHGARLQAVGYWHRHPEGMPRPSGGDLNQARRLLEALPATPGGPPWLLVIILQAGADPRQAIYPYRLEAGWPAFRLLEWEVVPDDAPELRAALEQEPAGLAASELGHYWLHPDFRFQFTPAGRQRLEREQAALERLGCRVQARQRKEDRRISFLIEAPGQAYLCVFPAEYPLGMPRLFRLPGGEELYPLARRPVWNSDVLVAEWLAQVERPQPAAASTPSAALAPASPKAPATEEPAPVSIPIKIKTPAAAEPAPTPIPALPQVPTSVEPAAAPPRVTVLASPPGRAPVVPRWRDLPVTVLAGTAGVLIGVFLNRRGSDRRQP